MKRKIRRKTPKGRPFQAGNPGRPKGIPNKVTRTAKENIEKVFEALGGWAGMMIWAKKTERNQTIFYSEIFPKLIPLDLHHGGSNGGPIIFQMPRPK